MNKDLVKQTILKIENKKTDDAYITYRDVPDLKLIIAELESNQDDSEDALMFVYHGYDYIAKAYVVLGRFSVAAIYHLRCLQIAKELRIKHHCKTKDIKEVLAGLLRDRNYYIDDDCEDVKELVKGLISKKEIEKIFKERMEHRRSFKNDPVEMSEEYLAVIDEVEAKIEENRTIKGHGSCHEIWYLKGQFLMEKGIMWTSPALLNRHIMFD